MSDIEPRTVDNRSYLGNTLIKRDGVAMEWTPENIIEFQKCSEDPIYFIEKYIKIVTLDHGLKKIKLYGYQKELIEALHKERFVIANTARQSGKSTTISAFICWYVIFNEGKTVGVLSKEEGAVKEVMFRIQTAYENIPKWLQQGVVEWNKRSFVLENGSRVKTSTTSRSAFRGDSINFLYIDEAAHIERWGDIASSVMPTINSGMSTKLCMTSTPNGLNHFWNYWDNAVKGKNGYYYVEVPWQKVPMGNGKLRDEAWKQKALADLNFDMEKFRQENECVAGETRISIKNKHTGEVHNVTIEEAYDMMKQNAYCVYCLIRDDGMMYVGKAKNLKNRLIAHKKSKRFQGHTFECKILHESNDHTDIIFYEKYYVEKLKTFEHGLNETKDGSGNHCSPNFTTFGRNFTAEHRAKMSQNHHLKHGGVPSMLGKKHSDKCKKEWSQKRKGKCWAPLKFSDKQIIEILNLYKSHPFIALVGTKQKNGKLLSYNQGFARTYSDQFGMTSNHIKNIVTGKNPTWRPYFEKIMLSKS